MLVFFKSNEPDDKDGGDCAPPHILQQTSAIRHHSVSGFSEPPPLPFVKVFVVTAEDWPPDTAIALIVVVSERVSASVYCVLLAVGLLPLVV